MKNQVIAKCQCRPPASHPPSVCQRGGCEIREGIPRVLSSGAPNAGYAVNICNPLPAISTQIVNYTNVMRTGAVVDAAG
jgi:hypothetical protein